MQRRRGRWSGLILRVLVSGGLLLAIFSIVDVRAIWAVWREADLRLVDLAVLVQVGALALSSWRWQMLLQAQGQHQPYPWLLGTTLVGQFANNFLPTMVGGDTVRIVQLGRRIDGYSRATTSVFLDRLFGFLALSLIATLALLGAALIPAADTPQTSPVLQALTLGFALAALTVAGGALSAPWLLPRLTHRLPARVQRPLQQVVAALEATRADRRGVLLALVLGLAFQLTWVLMHLVCAWALGLAVSPLLVALMVPITDIVGLAPIFINNLGAREVIFTLYLSQVGVPPATAVALAFLAFTVRLAVSLLGGLVALARGWRLSTDPAGEPAGSEEHR
ncbi:flippase-like domain-containing protein [Scytonema tolypothrichoides VB-61278]|nr:flippase-like domain-containing protein [Scytonema tolypothrichoides VB-61278]